MEGGVGTGGAGGWRGARPRCGTVPIVCLVNTRQSNINSLFWRWFGRHWPPAALSLFAALSLSLLLSGGPDRSAPSSASGYNPLIVWPERFFPPPSTQPLLFLWWFADRISQFGPGFVCGRLDVVVVFHEFTDYLISIESISCHTIEFRFASLSSIGVPGLLSMFRLYLCPPS